jgi:hypothetical protein
MGSFVKRETTAAVAVARRLPHSALSLYWQKKKTSGLIKLPGVVSECVQKMFY